jgi:starch phosphorylase
VSLTYRQLNPDLTASSPDPWLNHANAWEIPRHDVTIDIRFYGNAERIGNTGRAIWSGGQEVVAVAYDVPIPGYATKNTNSESYPLRLERV